MCRVIAIANQKGGVGKTTTTACLGFGLAREGKKVLLIDADAQGSLTLSCGVRNLKNLNITIVDILEDVIKGEEIDLNKGILHHDEGIDLLPSNVNLSGIDIALSEIENREYILKQYVEIQRSNYDYILIDCMPALGLFTVNVFACADSVLIPMQPDYLVIEGLQEILRTIGIVRRKINPGLGIEGILITGVDGRRSDPKKYVAQIREAYGDNLQIYETIIPMCAKVPKAPVIGVSLYTYSRRCSAAKAYMAITKEVLSNE